MPEPTGQHTHILQQEPGYEKGNGVGRWWRRVAVAGMVCLCVFGLYQWIRVGREEAARRNHAG